MSVKKDDPARPASTIPRSVTFKGQTVPLTTETISKVNFILVRPASIRFPFTVSAEGNATVASLAEAEELHALIGAAG